MKAVVYTKFGPPEVLQLREVEMPVPSESEVRIKIHAAAVSKEDPDFRKSPGINGFRKPKREILGEYFAGEIEECGADVKRFSTGDKVYGNTAMRFGAYAQFMCLPENGPFTVMPADMTFEEAAAVPNGGITALPFLRDRGRISSGQKVLIYGASGAVGTSAVQIAKYFDTEVTGVCSTTNLELIQSLGADHVIDYTHDDFTGNGEKYDIIFDTVGKASYSRSRNSLSENGIYLSTVPTPGILPGLVWSKLFGGKKARLAFTGLHSAVKKKECLDTLRKMIDEKRLQAVIDTRFPLDQAAEAHRYVAGGHKKGNVVLTVQHDSR